MPDSPGNCRWKKRMDGKACVKGYDSHFSPKKKEIIIFNSRCILPKYIVVVHKRSPNCIRSMQTGAVLSIVSLRCVCLCPVDLEIQCFASSCSTKPSSLIAFISGEVFLPKG